MKILILLFSLSTAMSVQAQEAGAWKIILNKKNVLKGTTASPDTTRLRITKDELSNNGTFKVEFDSKNDPKGWARTVGIYDTTEASVAQRDSTWAFYIYNKDLLKILWSRKRVYLYSWTSPLDKGMAAAIRIRRYKLCTIELID